MKYDLHTHSYCSDGQLSPSALVDLAAESGVTHLALTDHDTIKGLVEAQAAAEQKAITLINGIEFSATWHGQLIHIVGLGIKPNNKQLLSGVSENQQRRDVRAAAMLEDLLANEIDLSEELPKVLAGAVPTRPHFAQALINLGFAKNKRQAFKRYLVRGKPGFIPMQWPSLQEVGHWISAAGGVAVLAHPLRYKLSRTKLIILIEEMKEAGIEGIEVATTSTTRQHSEMLSALAIQYELLCSIGSDFHSIEQPWARLGGVQLLAKNVEPVWARLNI